MPWDVRVLARPLLEPAEQQPRPGDRGDELAEADCTEVVAAPPAEGVERSRRRVLVVKQEDAARTQCGRNAAGERLGRAQPPERAVAEVDEIPAPEQQLGR